MEHLSTQDTHRLFAFLHDLYDLRDHDGFTQHVVRGIADLVSADLYSYNEISTSRQLVTGYAIWPVEFPLLRNAPEVLGRYQHQHPTVAHYLATGGGEVTKISDFMSYRQFRRTDLHNEFYRPMGIPYGIGFGISLAQDGLIGIGLHRSGRDYSERDRRMLSELHPHILQACENAQAVTRMLQGTAARHQALDTLDSAIACLSTHTTIRWTTPHADALLHDYQLIVPRSSNRLHSRVSDWLKKQDSALSSPSSVPAAPRPLIIHGAQGIVTIRLVRQGQVRLLLLDESRTFSSETALGQLGLSPRETEVLSWVAQGKTNPEIGAILGISPRTVQKHLERLYGHLGVENRHAAMSIAMEAMRRGRLGT